jgi:Holliday junction resolvase RusA-like endonuclease
MTDAAALAFSFFVPGDVVPWARAGGGKTGHRFTPTKQRNYAGVLKSMCVDAMHGGAPLAGPIRLALTAVYPWPKSMSAGKRQAPGAQWRVSKPDVDNCMKIVGDALNKVAWLDDAQIAVASLCKVYGEQPGLEVSVEVLA